MSTWYTLNACLSVLMILVFAFLNLFAKKRKRLHVRLGFLGIFISFGIITNMLISTGVVAPLFLIRASMYFWGWFAALVYLSFLIDITSARRSKYFYFSYAIPFALAILTAGIDVFWFHIVLLAGGTVTVGFFSIYFTLAWIRAATDNRARRDGEWMLMVFIAFGLVTIVSYTHQMTEVFWLLSIWYLVLHIAVHHLGITEHLSSPENIAIIDNVFDIVVILDHAGKIVRLNSRGFTLTGCSASRMYGNGLELLVSHPELSAGTRTDWLARYSWFDTGVGQSRSPSIDAWVMCDSGEEIPVDLRVLALADSSRRVSGYVVSATDMRITRQLMKEISDREYAARDLALSESKFSRLFYYNPVGILIVRVDTLEVAESNPAAEEIFEVESKTLKLKKLSGLGLELKNMTLEEFIKKMEEEGSVPELDATIHLDMQHVKVCRLSAVSIELNRALNIIVSISDVTRQEQLREALDRKQKVETIGILAGGIAHDFNNILAVILGHIGLAKLRIKDPHSRVPIEKAEAACLRAREMTGNLLSFSRGGKPVLGVCTIKPILVDFAMQAVSQSSTACLFDISRDVWAVRADQTQLGQVVSNLVGNASQAMDKAGIVEIRARNRDFSGMGVHRRPAGISGKVLPPGRYVEICIKDYGPGIPDKIRKQIFDPFFTTKQKGSGLGLSIVYSVIENHEGIIDIESSIGEGTSFILYLPAAIDALESENSGEYGLKSASRRVLLMDDDQAVREAASGLLETLGFSVVEAVDGYEAVVRYRDALVNGHVFDFCLLDQIVPNGMSGSECAKEILTLDPEAVLFLCSGYSDDPIFSEYREAGFRALIKKPYTLEELKSTLGNHLVS